MLRQFTASIPEVYLKLCQTPMIRFFAKITFKNHLLFWQKNFVIEAWHVLNTPLNILCPKRSSIYNVRKIFQKTNISDPLIRTRTCAYQGVRIVYFLENFGYVLNGWSLKRTTKILAQYFEWWWWRCSVLFFVYFDIILYNKAVFLLLTWTCEFLSYMQ